MSEGQKNRFWTKKRFYDGVFNFFVVVMGVWLAVYVNGKNDQKHRNKETKTKIFSMILESNYNVNWGKRIMEVFSNDSSTTIVLTAPHLKAAESVLADNNLLNVIEPYQASIVVSYLNGMSMSGKIHAKYEAYLEMSGFRSTEGGIKLRKQIRDHAASDLAMCYVVQKEFSGFEKESKFDMKVIDSLEMIIKTAKKNILEGKAKFNK